MNVVIFGIKGQDGYYLSNLFKEKGFEVIGFSKSGEEVTGDIRDFNFVKKIVLKYKPFYIFHLAANSTTNHNSLFENHNTIATGTINILESVYRYSPDSKIFLTGSGVQFFNDGKPISETTSFEASSPYSIARIQSVYAARYYRTLGVKSYVGYLFHHESPFRKPRHMSQKIVSFAKEIKHTGKGFLEIGNISVVKEWTYALDTVRAIVTLVEQDKIYEVVIGTGIVHSIKDWIEICFSKLNLDWKNYIKETDNFKPEYMKLVSDPELMFSLGWKPEVNFEQLCEIMLAGK
jgi:GDPmannose 4,6-dehydratase